MNQLLLDLGAILLLLLANGFFSMAEIAIVSSSRPKLKHLAAQGDMRAEAALELAAEPNRFLSTIQVGITLVGVVTAVFSGARFSEAVAKPMLEIAWLAPYAEEVSFSLVVGALTICTLVIGELVPKRLGLSNPEGIARAVAPMMRRMASLCAPLVAVLGFLTGIFIKLLRVRDRPEAMASEEEIQMMVREGSLSGHFHEREASMVSSVMALDKLHVSNLMTPRTRIIWVSVNDSDEMLWHKVVVSGHSTFPVYENTQDNVLGTISVKSIYATIAAGIPVKIRNLIVPPVFVPATQTATSLLEKFQQSTKHVMLVLDEFGGISGLVTLHDLMEAIVGDLPSQGDLTRPTALRTDDGKWLVDGMLDTEGFEELIPACALPPLATRDYQTIAGFVMKHLGRMPEVGESFDYSGYRIQILDLDGYRIDKLLLMPQPDPWALPVRPAETAAAAENRREREEADPEAFSSSPEGRVETQENEEPGSRTEETAAAGDSTERAYGSRKD
ncbi:MAG: corC 1 [Verrucomicrobiales bacterium]|nr:corC 1 [Verrucomicrobiales bacterium]